MIGGWYRWVMFLVFGGLAAACSVLLGYTPLDQDTLDRVEIAADIPGWGLGSPQIQPGTAAAFRLVTQECCVYFAPVKTYVRWSVTPESWAYIEPETGVLILKADVPHDTRLVVTADLENGRRVVSMALTVYDPAVNPLVGIWHEESEIDCSDGRSIDPAEKIGELVINADGTFLVTWHPFEAYRDYGGRYTYDRAAGTVVMEAQRINYLPDDFAGSGTFLLDESGRLVLEGVFFGTPPGGNQPRACGYRFAR